MIISSMRGRKRVKKYGNKKWSINFHDKLRTELHINPVQYRKAVWTGSSFNPTSSIFAFILNAFNFTCFCPFFHKTFSTGVYTGGMGGH